MVDLFRVTLPSGTRHLSLNEVGRGRHELAVHNLDQSTSKVYEGTTGQVNTKLNEYLSSFVNDDNAKLVQLDDRIPFALGAPLPLMPDHSDFRITCEYNDPSLCLSLTDNDDLLPGVLKIYARGSQHMAILVDYHGRIMELPLNAWMQVVPIHKAAKHDIELYVNIHSKKTFTVLGLKTSLNSEDASLMDALNQLNWALGKTTDDTHFAIGIGETGFVIYRPFEDIYLVAEKYLPSEHAWTLHFSDGLDAYPQVVMTLPVEKGKSESIYWGSVLRVRVAIRNGQVVKLYRYQIESMCMLDECHPHQTAALSLLN